MGNHAYQGSLPKQGWRGAMSLPRRLSLCRKESRYVLRQEAEPAAIASVQSTALDASRVPMAARFDLPANTDCALALTDCDGRQIRLERRGDLLVLTRRDPASPFLDHAQPIQLGADAAITLWLDHGSAEVIAADGTVCATLQHRMAGSECALQFKVSAEA
jgi:fructan beta-fructosidase